MSKHIHIHLGAVRKVRDADAELYVKASALLDKWFTGNQNEWGGKSYLADRLKKELGVTLAEAAVLHNAWAAKQSSRKAKDAGILSRTTPRKFGQLMTQVRADRSAEEKRAQGAVYKVQRQQKNGKLGAPSPRFDINLTEEAAKKRKADLERMNPGSQFVVTKDASPFETIYAQYEDLNRKVKEASVKLQAFPKGSMGLTPDDVKKSPAYRQAMNEFNLYNEKSKALASLLMKNFKTEMKNRPRSYTRAGDAASVAISPSLQKQIGSVGSTHREDMPADVFLEPASRKYPVKEKEDGDWKWSKKLLLAAAREARMQGDIVLAKRADEIRAREFGADE